MKTKYIVDPVTHNQVRETGGQTAVYSGRLVWDGDREGLGLDDGIRGAELVARWHTKQIEGATHVIDDGGMIYWSVTPEMTNDQVAGAFRVGYDGTLGNYDVTDLRTDERTDYSA